MIKINILYKILAISLAVIFVWSLVEPHDYFTWFMEAFPVLITVPILFVSREKFRLTPLIYMLIFAHMVVLLVGAHYTYAEVPLFNWLRDYFHLSRNHYDRFGHFMQGFVPAMIGRELLIRTSPLKPGKWMFTILCLSCLGISALYEILEWVTAVWKGEAAEAFLGTQGDVWDTQIDMAFAFIGAVVGQVSLYHLHNYQIQRIKK